MTENYIHSAGDSAKICLTSTRHLYRHAYYCGLYEVEDVLIDTGNVDLVCPERGVGFETQSRLLDQLHWHDKSGKSAFTSPGVKSVRLKRDYDVFIAVANNDLLHVNAVKGWKDRCRTSICWLHEVWASSIHKYGRRWLETLREFDYVFVSLFGSVEPLSKALGRPCYWLPSGTDLMRFGPQTKPVSRVIDVMSIGRRQEGMHRALVGMASRNELFYMFDTFNAAAAQVYDYRQHRDHFARMAKRSRYFMVAPAKMDDPYNETGGQIEFGDRYHEGAAAGTVMLGQSPDVAHFRSLFGWQDSVIEVAPDGSDICDTIRNLDAEPERIRQISHRNIVESLLQHDWMHRWNDIFRIVGIKPYDNMVARTDYLKDLASVLVSREGANRIEGRYAKEYA